MRPGCAPALALLLAMLTVAPAAAHHTGTYTPRDNAITTNFKQLKFSVQAGKFDVARRLFDEGPLSTYTHCSLALSGRTLSTHSVHLGGCGRLGEIKGS